MKDGLYAVTILSFSLQLGFTALALRPIKCGIDSGFMLPLLSIIFQLTEHLTSKYM